MSGDYTERARRQIAAEGPHTAEEAAAIGVDPPYRRHVRLDLGAGVGAETIGVITGDTGPEQLQQLAALLRAAADQFERTAGAPPAPLPVAHREFVTSVEAAHVLSHFGCAGGYQPGGFTRDLVRSITRADPENRARFALGFPGYVAAVNLAQNDGHGIAQLQAIAAENVAP